MTVLSVNVYAMGHIAYQLGLERGFAENMPEIDFRSIHLSEANRSDLLGRVAYKLATCRLPGPGNRDFDWIRLRSELASSFFLRRLLQRTLPSVRPDVLHIHTQSIALLSQKIFREIPSVVSLDCTSALLARIHPWPAVRTYRPIIRLEQRCLAAAAHVVCWSETARRSVVQDYGIAPERTSVILPAVRHQLFRDDKQSRRPGARLRLLFVGNDFKRKGGEDLLAVFRDQLHSTCELDVVSNGIGDLPAQDGLRLHRGLAPLSDELMKLYSDADVFVMPTHEDAFGLVFLEAMAAGLPCIGSDVLAVPELVADGARGFVVQPGNRQQLASAIERLRDDNLRVQMGRAGRRFVQTRCDDATNCRRLLDIFEQSAARRSAGLRIDSRKEIHVATQRSA
jgi:glycosyltransferase involved in cell wall biosynthesis